MAACTFFSYFEICITCHYVNCSGHRQLQYHIWNTNICVLDGFSFFQILSGWEPKDMSYADAVFITHTDSSTSSHPPLTSSSSSNPQKPATFSHQPTSSEKPTSYHQPTSSKKSTSSHQLPIKDLLEWKEEPVDTLALCFYQLQNYFLAEIRRGFAGIGNYKQKAQHQSITCEPNEILLPQNLYKPNNIVNQIKK